MSRAVRDMFASIAGRYDRANAVLSLGVHGRWRRKAADLLDPRPGERVLDLCSGTGDLALVLAGRVGESGRVVGADFCASMLALAREKTAARGLPAPHVDWVLADALALPFRSASFDAATIAFGIRNVDDPSASLRELGRVVRPGGRIVVLEFGVPRGPLFGPVYRWYARAVIPRLGALVTGERAPYEYLPRTQAAFPAGEAFQALMAGAGLARPRAVPLTFGIAYAYRAEVPEAPAAPAGAGGSHAARARA